MTRHDTNQSVSSFHNSLSSLTDSTNPKRLLLDVPPSQAWSNSGNQASYSKKLKTALSVLYFQWLVGHNDITDYITGHWYQLMMKICYLQSHTRSISLLTPILQFLTPKRTVWHFYSLFLQAGCPFCHPTNSIKASERNNAGNIMHLFIKCVMCMLTICYIYMCSKSVCKPA